MCPACLTGGLMNRLFQERGRGGRTYPHLVDHATVATRVHRGRGGFMTVGERACFAPPRQWYWRRHCWMRLRVVSRLCGFASLFVCQCTCVCVSYGVIASFVSSCTLSLLHCARVRIMSTVFAQDLWSHVCLIPRSIITSKGQMLRRSDVE